MFTIRKNIPLAKALRAAAPQRRKYPFDEMDVGDMFFVPDKTKNTLATHASTVGKQLGRKFVTRLTYMVDPKGKGLWVEAEATTPGAVLGIGVWRTE